LAKVELREIGEAFEVLNLKIIPVPVCMATRRSSATGLAALRI